MYNILTVNKQIPIHCITVLLTGQQFVYLLSAFELLTECLIFIGSTSQMILKSAVVVYNIEMSSTMALSRFSDNFEKMKEHNKSVIDWFLGQQQLCLNLEQTCCPQPAALGSRTVQESNKTAVVLEPSQ